MRLHFQHGVGFQFVVALEGRVEADDPLGCQGDHAAKAVLGDGVGQADQEHPLCDGEDRLTRHGLGVDLGRERQASLEDQFEEDVLL